MGAKKHLSCRSLRQWWEICICVQPVLSPWYKSPPLDRLTVAQCCSCLLRCCSLLTCGSFRRMLCIFLVLTPSPQGLSNCSICVPLNAPQSVSGTFLALDCWYAAAQGWPHLFVPLHVVTPKTSWVTPDGQLCESYVGSSLPFHICRFSTVNKSLALWSSHHASWSLRAQRRCLRGGAGVPDHTSPRASGLQLPEHLCFLNLFLC